MVAEDIILSIMAATGAAIITAITILLDPIVRAAGARRRQQ